MTPGLESEDQPSFPPLFRGEETMPGMDPFAKGGGQQPRSVPTPA